VRQVLLRIPIPGTDHVLPLHGYGLAMAAGFLLAILTAARRARRDGSPPEVVHNAALACFFGGVFGARAFFVLQNHEQFDGLFALLRIWEGGLTFYGGFLVATLATVGYLHFSRRNVLYWLDVITPSMALGLACGRIGCFLNGCCYGDVARAGPGMVWPVGSIPWYHYAEEQVPAFAEAVRVFGGPGGAAVSGAVGGAAAAVWEMPAIHPAQVYALVNALGLALVLSLMFWRRRRNGQILLTFAVLYGITRYLLEAIRADEPETYLLGLPTLLRLVGAREAAETLPGLTISQNIAVVMVAGGGLLLWRLLKSRRPSLVVERDAEPQGRNA
jgi:phosphatidylglycerol:prolipoprotein diacylglycerol transferase